MTEFAPAFPLFLAALALAFVGRNIPARLVIILIGSIWSFASVWTVPFGPVWTLSFLDMTLVPLEGRPVGLLFGSIFAFTAGLAGLFALQRENVWELPAAFTYAGGALGVVFSGDWITLLVYWEVMAVASTLVIWCGGQAQSYAASIRYIMVHLLGGVFLMAGIAGLVAETGSTAIDLVSLESTAGVLILIGVLVNAAAPPLSAWAPDAYPEASPSGTVFLSAFTTKTAVCVLWLTFPGAEVLVWLGLYMAIYGVIYALLENDMRRVLVYALVNQVGFLVAAVGMGTAMTMNGAAAHSVAHILYKGLLLMTAGVVLHATGKRLMTDLGGLHKTMPFTTACAVIAMLTGAAVPFTAAFATKSLISSGAGYAEMGWAWSILTATGAAIFAGSMLRFVWFVFFAEPKGLRASPTPWNMQVAMGIATVLCVFIGIYPDLIYKNLPLTMEYYSPLKFGSIVFQLQLLGFAALAFFIFKGLITPRPERLLDWDWFYRKFFSHMAHEFRDTNAAKRAEALAEVQDGLAHTVKQLENTHGEGGSMARTWPSGSMTLWATVLLAAVLVAYYMAGGDGGSTPH